MKVILGLAIGLFLLLLVPSCATFPSMDLLLDVHEGPRLVLQWKVRSLVITNDLVSTNSIR